MCLIIDEVGEIGHHPGPMNARLLIVLSFLLLLSFHQIAAADDKPWTEIRSPHFRVLTDGSIPDARKVAFEFEQLRNVFANRFPNAKLEGAPLVVFAVRNEESAKALEPNLWKSGANRAGEYHRGWEKQFAIVRLDTWDGDGAKEVVYHEYTHSIDHMNLHYLPLWLDEGNAEFYAYTRFQGNQIFLGAPTERYRTLRSRTPIPVETFIGLNARSPYYLDASQNQLFYAEAWALVHFLIYGKDMENGKRLGEFTDLLQQGIDQKKAFTQVFGDFRKIDKSLESYMQQPTFRTTVLKDLPKVDQNGFAARTMTVAETEAELGTFHLWTHDLPGAHRLIEQALKDDPKLGLAHEAMGFHYFSEGKDGEAEQEFSQASTLDGHLYLSQFYKTMLSPLPYSTTVSGVNTFGAALGKSLQINPDFAPAFIQLAKIALRVGDLDSALKISRRAEEIEPSLAGYHILTGEILRRMGNTADAGAYAKFVVEHWIGPDHDEALELWNRLPAGERPVIESAPDVIPNTQTMEGTIQSVSCGAQDKEPSLILSHDGQTLTFHRKSVRMVGYSDTIWYGADHFTLCHRLEGMRAVISYSAPSDATYAGDLVELGVRDDVPLGPQGAKLSQP